MCKVGVDAAASTATPGEDFVFSDRVIHWADGGAQEKGATTAEKRSARADEATEISDAIEDTTDSQVQREALQFVNDVALRCNEAIAQLKAGDETTLAAKPPKEARQIRI